MKGSDEMNKESLIKARDIIIEALDKGDIQSQQDIVELMINLNHFLDEEKYERNIQVLREAETKEVRREYQVKSLTPRH